MMNKSILGGEWRRGILCQLRGFLGTFIPNSAISSTILEWGSQWSENILKYTEPEKGGAKASIQSIPMFPNIFHPETLHIPDSNWFRSRGVDPTFLIMYEHKGGVNPVTFCQKCMGTRGVTPQNEACMSARCWKCIIGRGIEPENVCFVGGTTDKSQWLHKLF